jgi:hypothetical protein
VDYLLLLRLVGPYEMLFFSHVGLAWVLPRRVLDFFACWRGLGGSL